jgi:hypothetical protein
MSIKDNVIEVREQILADEAYARRIKTAALKAILGGNKEWVEYMRFFAKADKPQQLARLIPTDDTHTNDAMQEARAYLVASAPCTPATVNNMVNAVGDVLDEGLAD